MKVKDIIKQLQQYEDQDCELVFDMFDESDIRNKAEDLGIDLTDDELHLTIEYLERYTDAEEGMSWDTIEYAIKQTTRKAIMNKINLKTAFKISDTQMGIMCLYERQYITLYLSNIEVTGEKLGQYEFDQENKCVSASESLNERINNAIELGEADENKDLYLYISLRDIKDEINNIY